ncbi:MAG: alpha/beta hydrolase [Alphaproteobacteria bacterium]
MAKKAFRLFVEILAIYLFVVVVVFFYQRNMQYFPFAADNGLPKDAGVPEMSVVHVKTADGLELVGWFAPPKKEDGRVVVFYHGNGGNIAMRGFKARYFIDRGYGVFLVEYRGYGGNPGSPTEEGLYNDGRAALKFLKEKGYKDNQIVIYGESVGTGVAVQMALETQPEILILESPFSSAADVAKKSYPFLPVDLLMHDRYDSIDKIGKIKSHLLIVHGGADNIIGIQLSYNLFDAARSKKKFFGIKGGGHNDLYDFNAGTMIADWLDTQVAGEK